MIKRIQNIKKRIEEAAGECGRDPSTVRLVAVSKTIPVNRVREAIEAGVTVLGENYVQEAREKFNRFGDIPGIMAFYRPSSVQQGQVCCEAL